MSANRIRSAAVALSCAVVAGCGLFASKPQPPCPRVIMVDEAARVTLYRPGPGRDLTDVRFEAAIDGVLDGCEYDEDGFVDADVNISIALTRGPAAESNTARLEYFVVVTNPDDKILAKRVFPVVAEFPDKILRVGVPEQTTQRIFLEPGADARDHRIYIGFQLSREQLDEIRKRRR